MKTSPTAVSQPPSVPLEWAWALLDRAPFGVAIVTASGLLWLNQVLRDLDSMLCREDAPQVREGAEWCASGRIDVVDDYGVVHSWECCGDVPMDEVHTVRFFRNATAEKALQSSIEQLQRKLFALETRDPETGLLNHLGISAALDRELGRSRRYGNPVAIVRIDVDAPHAPDDEDARLRELSLEFRARLRWADELGRVDRNRFLLILPETTENSARALADTLLAEPIVLGYLAEGWRIETVIACWEKGDDRRRLLRRAGLNS